jgi:hypothetical protein
MTHCLWNNENDSHRYHLANWQLVSMKKEYGGLGVPNLRELNLCLLGSWVSRYFRDGSKIWKEGSITFSLVKKLGLLISGEECYGLLK